MKGEREDGEGQQTSSPNAAGARDKPDTAAIILRRNEGSPKQRKGGGQETGKRKPA